MLKFAILGLAAMCLLNVAAHAGTAARTRDMAAIICRWLPSAIAAGTAAALALGATAFLLSLAAG